MSATKTSYTVEWTEGGSALNSFTRCQHFAKRVDANRYFKAMRKKWIYVQLYQVVSTRTLLRRSTP